MGSVPGGSRLGLNDPFLGCWGWGNRALSKRASQITLRVLFLKDMIGLRWWDTSVFLAVSHPLESPDQELQLGMEERDSKHSSQDLSQ